MLGVCAQAALIKDKYAHKISHPSPKKGQKSSAFSFVSSGIDAQSESEVVISSKPNNAAISSASYIQSNGPKQDDKVMMTKDDKKDYYVRIFYEYV